MRWIVVALLSLMALGPCDAAAADKVVVGKSSPTAFSFTPVEIGIETGIFAKHGIDLGMADLDGSAKLHQAMAAGSLDFGLGSGPDMIFPMKGSPEIVVANMAGPPLLLSIIVPWDSAITTTDGLKGKRVGISTVNSLTQWLVLELGRQKGWQPDDFIFVTVGAVSASHVAALVTGQIDAVVSSTATGLQLQESKRGRILIRAADIVQDFMIHAIYASQKMVQEHPDIVRRFLAGWFETIAFMHANKAETVRIARTVTGFSQSIEDQEYDIVMPMFSLDGKFSASAMAAIQRSFVDLHLLDKEPDLSKYYTDAYLPKNATQ
jgi:NitT/TauT family transport system substrate-binding protein